MATIRRFAGDRERLRWRDVPVEEYADASVRGVTKQVVIGSREGASGYSVRYFEIAAGARSALDRHPHDHGVVIVTGAGRIRLGETMHEIGFGDAIYIAPDEVHQFENDGPGPLGFLCIVSSRPMQ
jgi:quercetin dioxygenase-like cupin family protein